MNDDNLNHIRNKLDHLAQKQQTKKAVIMSNVLEHIQTRQNARYGVWRMSGFALAAALTAFIVLPNTSVLDHTSETQAVAAPKLSPQMMEDLEMLMVLGEDKAPHGS
jgi:type VI protein secretion system component VasF